MIAGTDSSSVLAGGLQSLGRKMGTIRKCKSLNGCTKKHNGKVNKTLKEDLPTYQLYKSAVQFNLYENRNVSILF